MTCAAALPDVRRYRFRSALVAMDRPGVCKCDLNTYQDALLLGAQAARAASPGLDRAERSLL